MDFLKDILGEELFGQVSEKVNAHNDNEANKDKLVKLANLGSGEYVGKGKHESEIEKLQNMLNGKTSELNSANNLIVELKKASKGNEDFQNKISGYETQVAELQTQLVEAKIKAALKVGLLAEKCDDVDYITFLIDKNLKEQGKTLELDENDNIKGWDDLLSNVKTQQPTHFETITNGRRILGDNRLPGSNNDPATITKEDFNKMGYNSRVKLKAENPELYANMMKG